MANFIKDYPKIMVPFLSSIHTTYPSLGTDGVPVFKSFKFSLWPFFLTINELYKERIKKKNIIFAGLWYGLHKPFMLTFCKPIHESSLKLEQDGVTIKVNPGNEIVSKCFLLCGTCDLQSKALVCNCMQFNGKCDCSKCLQPGETCKTTSGGTVTVYLLLQENMLAQKELTREL